MAFVDSEPKMGGKSLHVRKGHFIWNLCVFCQLKPCTEFFG